MQLYKFLSKELALDDVSKRRIKISTFFKVVEAKD